MSDLPRLPLYEITPVQPPLDAWVYAVWPFTAGTLHDGKERRGGGVWRGFMKRAAGNPKSHPWVGRFEDAQMTLPPKKMDWQVFTTWGGEFVPLKAAEIERRWDRGPRWWRPMTAAEYASLGFRPTPWPWPLPHPIVQSGEGQMGRVDHIAFNAAEHAAEMEEDREAARANHGKNLESGRPELPFWRTFVIDYASTERRHVEARVMRALYFDARDRTEADMLKRQKTNAAVLADMKRGVVSREEIEMALKDATSDYVPPLVRRPEESSAAELAALAWVDELLMVWRGAARARKLAIDRAKDLPARWSSMAAKNELSVVRAKQLYDEFHDRLSVVAASGTPALDRNRIDLRDRTRKARREQ